MDNQEKMERLQGQISALRQDQLAAGSAGPEYIASRGEAIDEALDELAYTIDDERALRALDQHLPR
ncbi:hypothetical protein QFZ75_003665 [Streptomyces sp. V3I8]|uniref:hypothetical protein n=1 Tax=Streptomyces sp. V3I8 TaxID=3042279 RepID=UPI002782B639|nr:hypothetical protein [Streptomyces sp. V3I8]MDQ1037249.1 hypothetical protein [Streptomyces sp. V3I8]